MHKTGFGFAQGTSEDSKKVVMRMFLPENLLGAYRAARSSFGTGDIVLAASDQGPEIEYATRAAYKNHLAQILGARAREFKMWHESAQQVALLPAESEAMWLVVQLQNTDVPIMCVLYAVPYEADSDVPLVGALN